MVAAHALLLLIAALALTAGPALAGAGKRVLVFAGSGSNLPNMRLLAAEYTRTRPDITIDVPPSIGSTGAVRAAADGAVSAGLVSRPLRPPERELGLTVVPYARTALVIGVHPSVTDEDISGAELVQIYRGQRTRWRDGRPIIVLTREPGDSAVEVLSQRVPGFAEVYAESQAARRWATLYTNREANKRLAATPGAVGLADAGEIAAERLPIRMLAFEGVTPTAEHVRSGRYPLVKTLAVVFRPDRLSEDARHFVEFLASPEARRILHDAGYVTD